MTEYKSFFKTVGGNEGSKCKYSTRLDVYGKGCQHDCSYCYAKSLLSFRGLWDAEHPAEADLEKVRRKISKLPAGTIIRMGGMTDCFQPLELRRRLAYETIKILNEYGIGYLIVTKSRIIADDKYMWFCNPRRDGQGPRAYPGDRNHVGRRPVHPEKL